MEGVLQQGDLEGVARLGPSKREEGVWQTGEGVLFEQRRLVVELEAVEAELE